MQLKREWIKAYKYPYILNDFCLQPPPVSSNGFHNGHALESSPCEIPLLDSHRKFRQVGAGQGGEGAEDGKGHGPSRRGRDAGRGGSYHNWRDRKPLQKLYSQNYIGVGGDLCSVTGKLTTGKLIYKKKVMTGHSGEGKWNGLVLTYSWTHVSIVLSEKKKEVILGTPPRQIKSFTFFFHSPTDHFCLKVLSITKT